MSKLLLLDFSQYVLLSQLVQFVHYEPLQETSNGSLSQPSIVSNDLR